MKTWKYFFSFTGMMALCVVIGLGFFIYCDSNSQDETKDRPTIEVKIMVEDVDGEWKIKLDVDNTGKELIEATHNQEIKWTCDDPLVLDFLVFLGGNSPIGELGPDDEVKIFTEIGPEEITEDSKRVAKKVWHNPKQAGGRHAKYYVAVYYKPEGEEGRILMRDPEIIIPPRRRNR